MYLELLFLDRFGREIKGVEILLLDVADIEAEDRLPVWANETSTVFIVVISTYEGGSPPDSAAWFYKWLEEAAKDFR